MALGPRYSKTTQAAAGLLGARIRLARRQRRWSQVELAERIGVNSRTIYKIEHGDPSVGLGIAFEAAVLVGVALFHDDDARLRDDTERANAQSSLLTRPQKRPSDDVLDDF